MTMQQFCLRWNNHQPNFISVFSSLLNSESLVDVTLAAEGRHLQAHKVVLSACSSYFQSLFSINPCQHPIVILKDVKFIHLKVMVDFMYYGEVNVSQEQLPHILKTAEMLKIKGLAEMPDSTSLTKSQSSSTERAELLTPGDSNWSSDAQRRSLSPSPCPLSPSARRKRLRKSSTGSGSGSTERTSEEHPPEAILSPGPPAPIPHIKADPGFTQEPPHPMPKQHSSDSELHRESSQESDSDPPHQITLQIPQPPESNIIQQNMDSGPADLSTPSTSTGMPQSQLAGMQWALMEHGCRRFIPPPFAQVNTNVPSPVHQYSPEDSDPMIPECSVNANNADGPCQNYHSPCTSPTPLCHPNMAMPFKRKRSINPQGDENFVRALEAVRFGGIGFCKAARMFGVNNRTLWLEYKKRGYPISRPSIKNRIRTDIGPLIELHQQLQRQQQQFQQHVPPIQQQESQEQINTPESPTESAQVVCNPPPQPLDMLAAALSAEYPEELRHRYHETTVLTAAQINMQGINFS